MFRSKTAHYDKMVRVITNWIVIAIISIFFPFLGYFLPGPFISVMSIIFALTVFDTIAIATGEAEDDDGSVWFSNDHQTFGCGIRNLQCYASHTNNNKHIRRMHNVQIGLRICVFGFFFFRFFFLLLFPIFILKYCQ